MSKSRVINKTICKFLAAAVHLSVYKFPLFSDQRIRESVEINLCTVRSEKKNVVSYFHGDFIVPRKCAWEM